MPKVKPTAHGGRRKAASKRKASPPRRDAPAAAPQTKAAAEDPFMSSGLSLHELFEQQTRQMLDRTDLEIAATARRTRGRPADQGGGRGPVHVFGPFAA